MGVARAVEAEECMLIAVGLGVSVVMQFAMFDTILPMTNTTCTN